MQVYKKKKALEDIIQYYSQKKKRYEKNIIKWIVIYNQHLFIPKHKFIKRYRWKKKSQSCLREWEIKSNHCCYFIDRYETELRLLQNIVIPSQNDKWIVY